MEEMPDLEETERVRIRTQNSVYEIDQATKQVRRLSSNHEPTVRQEDDGVWQDYEKLMAVSIGSPLVVAWDVLDDRIKALRTSPIQDIQEVKSAEE